MLTIEQLVEESQDPRLQKLPNYARELIRLLANRMQAEASYAKAIEERAEKEVGEVRTLLAEGPAGSDTFMDLPRTTVAGYGDDPDQRPLGTGTTIEFRQPDMSPGEGISVTFNGHEGHLTVSGINHLAVVPVHPTEITIETR